MEETKETLKLELEQVKRERDAAIHDLCTAVSYLESCDFCKHANDGDYTGCGEPGCWEWTGAKCIGRAVRLEG